MIVVEALDFGCRRLRRPGDRKLGGRGVERLSAELAVEILRIFRRRIEMHDGGGAVAEREPCAAKPIFGERDLFRALRRRAQRSEMRERSLRLAEKPQGNPAGK